MLLSLFHCEFEEYLRRGMGCLFSCFRVKDDPRPPVNPVPQPITPKEPLDAVASNSLWSVLVPEAEDDDQSQDMEARSGITGSSVSDDDELRAEAKFLKACGTLPHTPNEIRNSKKSTDSLPQSGNMEATFHSWLPNTNTEKASEKQPDHLHHPIKLFEEWDNELESSPHSPNSYITGKSPDSNCTTSSEGCMVTDLVKETHTLNSSISHTPMVPSTQCKNKSVRFEDISDSSSSSSSSKNTSEKITDQNLKPSGTPCDQSVKPSPYPTPLKLTNDMQTPGTVFPSYVYNMESGKNPKIRLQYVYSGVDPEIFSRLEPPIEEMLNLDQFEECFEKNLDLFEECFEKADKETPQSQINWNNNLNVEKVSWWDGNGIPNTTHKYKEDQKVSWHATPFEERLEKALSDDKFINERKNIGQTLPMRF